MTYKNQNVANSDSLNTKEELENIDNTNRINFNYLMH